MVSTSTRNFPNRLGTGANVFLASAELAAVAAILGKLPTPAEYQEYAEKINATAADTYRYLNFHKMPQYTKKSRLSDHSTSSLITRLEYIEIKSQHLLAFFYAHKTLKLNGVIKLYFKSR